MKFLAHKTDPILLFQLTNQELHSNHIRVIEFIQTAQRDRHFLNNQGILNIQSSPGNGGGGVILQLTFSSIDALKSWVAERMVYSEEQFTKMCRDLGKNPQEYLQNAEALTNNGFSGHGFTIRF